MKKYILMAVMICLTYLVNAQHSTVKLPPKTDSSARRFLYGDNYSPTKHNWRIIYDNDSTYALVKPYKSSNKNSTYVAIHYFVSYMIVESDDSLITRTAQTEVNNAKQGTVWQKPYINSAGYKTYSFYILGYAPVNTFNNLP